MVRYSCYLLLIFTSLLACKPQPMDSDVKHSWEETRRITDDFQFSVVDCTKERDPSLPVSTQFLETLGLFMMRANPNTFYGKLAPEHFCFAVKNQEISKAYSKPSERLIVFHPEAFVLHSDFSVLAAVMAHELAHITMLHLDLKHPDYLPTAEYSKLDNQIQSLVKENKRRIELFDKRWQQEFSIFAEEPEIMGFIEDTYDLMIEAMPSNSTRIKERKEQLTILMVEKKIKPERARSFNQDLEEYANLNRLNQTLVGDIAEIKKRVAGKDPQIGMEEAHNWEEREADEVGFEIFVRSGFAVSKFEEYIYLLGLLSLDRKSLTECQRTGMRALIDNSIPELLHGDRIKRGTRSHPLPCWRYLHSLHHTSLHNDDIAKHPARPIPNDLQRLYREAKKELKAAGDRTRTPTNEQNDTEIREPIPTTNTEK